MLLRLKRGRSRYCRVLFVLFAFVVLLFFSFNLPPRIQPITTTSTNPPTPTTTTTTPTPFSNNNLQPRKNPTAEDYLRIYNEQMRICGALCQIPLDLLVSEPRELTTAFLSSTYRLTRFHCVDLFSRDASLAFDGPPLEWPPPRDIPLRNQFLLPHARLSHAYFTNRYAEGEALISTWTKAYIQEHLDKLKRRELHGTYGMESVNGLFDFLSKHELIHGQRILVVGTEQPWVEAVLLELGANTVVTLEYGKIVSEHDKLIPITPEELNVQFRGGEIQEFDGVVSFSSLEHSGLGRYGDRLSPFGDVYWVAKLSCVIKHGGFLVVGLPSGTVDQLVYNAHRVYGPNRWPLLLQNWKVEDVSDFSRFNQHVTVLARNQRTE